MRQPSAARHSSRAGTTEISTTSSGSKRRSARSPRHAEGRNIASLNRPSAGCDPKLGFIPHTSRKYFSAAISLCQAGATPGGGLVPLGTRTAAVGCFIGRLYPKAPLAPAFLGPKSTIFFLRWLRPFAYQIWSLPARWRKSCSKAQAAFERFPTPAVARGADQHANRTAFPARQRNLISTNCRLSK